MSLSPAGLDFSIRHANVNWANYLQDGIVMEVEFQINFVIKLSFIRDFISAGSSIL